MIVIEKFVYSKLLYSKFDVNYYIVNLKSIIDFYKRKEGINQLHTLEFLEDFNTISLLVHLLQEETRIKWITCIGMSGIY